MEQSKEIKCVVWDLDNTLWDGVLLEDSHVSIKPGIVDVLNTLDERGILLSIASKNDYDMAMSALEGFNIHNMFIYPQINWSAKSHSIETISEKLNIGKDTILFIDDQKYELEEVASEHPEVHCVSVSEYDKLLDMQALIPRFITKDSKRRRQMYFENIERTIEEDRTTLPKEEFIASLNMVFTVKRATEEDLQRAVELTSRTNQLNATGISYSYEELVELSSSSEHIVLICELEDRFGSYGKVGLSIIQLFEDYWHIKLLLMSCRVISRNLGNVLLTYIMMQCKRENKILRMDFIDTGRNRAMDIMLGLANFKQKEEIDDSSIILENTLKGDIELPQYLKIVSDGSLI